MVRDGRIDTIVVAITDMQGRLMGKRVQGQAFLDGVIDHGAHFCTYLLGTDMEMNTPEGFELMNWETGYGDWIAEPIWDPLRVLPWLRGRRIVLADTHRRGDRRGDPGLAADDPQAPGRPGRATPAYASRPARSSSSTCSRTRGRSLAERGWTIPRRFGYYNEDYHLLQATKAEPLHRLLRNQMTEANVPIEFSKGEAAPGQHEVNIRYDHVLESADRSVVFKHGAKEIAYLNGWGITFMAKPDHRWTGSSGHLHMSVWDVVKDVPLMPATGREKAGRTASPKVGQQFMAGMMALSRELAVFMAPNINSYKRYASLSWAPVNVVWGRDNRTTGFRLVGRGPGAPRRGPLPGRRHERVPDVRRDDRRRPVRHRAGAQARAGVQGQRLSRHRRAADAACAVRGDRRAGTSEAAREIFGEDVVDHYLNAARVEQETYDSVVHAWDRERYLERG